MTNHAFVAIGWTLAAVATAASTPRVAGAQSLVCPAADRFTAARELRYVVNARVRPLLFWIGRRNVGGGRITWSRGEGAERLELLVGSDPARTPMRVNRWGYLAETVCDAGADVLGVMTESEEASVDQASANASRGAAGEQAFRSIRSRVQGGRSDADVARVLLPGPLTYRDLGALLPTLSAATGEKHDVVVAEGTEPGFLVAVAALAERALATPPEHRRARAELPYVYNGQLFDLQLVSTAARDRIVTTEFQTRNRSTGRTTRFSIAFDTSDRALVPTRIQFRPRWWFEAELVLDRPATLASAANLAQRSKP